MDDIRRYIDILEGHYVPTVSYTLRVPLAAYDLARLLMKLADPHAYTTASTTGKDAILMFYEPEQYQNVAQQLKQFGIDFEDIEPEARMPDGELRQDDTNQQSPYPGNSEGWSAYREFVPKGRSK